MREARAPLYCYVLRTWKEGQATRRDVAGAVKHCHAGAGDGAPGGAGVGAGAAARAESLIEPLGADGVRAQNPETRPRKIKKSPAPAFHALRKAVRKALWEAYGHFLAAFREAAVRWREGDRVVAFPVGSFPPGLPFVEA